MYSSNKTKYTEFRLRLIRDIRTFDERFEDKQNTIIDLASIRDGAALGATAVQPEAISDMETKTNAAATYLPLTGGDLEGNLYAPYIESTEMFAETMTCENLYGTILNDSDDRLYFDSEGMKVMNNGSELYSLVTKTQLDEKLGDINTILESIINS